MNKIEHTRNIMDSIEKERIQMNISQAEMAKRLEISTSTYKKMVAGDIANIGAYTLYKACQVTGKHSFELAKATDSYLSALKKLLMLKDHPSSYKFIESVMDFEINRIENRLENVYTITVFVPTGNMEDGMIYDSSSIEEVIIPSRYKDIVDCGIKVTSNHLNPAYHLGDILLIRQAAPRDGDTGVFLNKKTNSVYIRKYHQTKPCKLEPINGFGKTFLVDPYSDEVNDWFKFGYVVSKITT